MTKKITMSKEEAETYLIEHIIRGDSSDGVPNVLSSDDSIIMKTRQTPITKSRLATLMEQGRTRTFSDTSVHRNWIRNEYMIDLSHTPQLLRDEIMQQYESQAGKGRDKVFGYLMSNRMKHLMEYCNEF